MESVGIMAGGPVDFQKRSSKPRPVFNEPLKTILVSRIHVPLLWCHITGGKHRDESDDRANLDGDALLTELKMVVVKAVHIVPETCPTELIHRLDDAGKMSDEFRAHIGIDGIMHGEFQ